MELLSHTTEWAKGDALQGKIMLFAGILLLVACYFILKNDNGILKGSLIPLGLVILICVGYGGFLTFSRPAHITKAEENYAIKPNETIKAELTKAERDNNNYSMIKKVWPVLIILTCVMYFIVSTEYLKGLSIGLIVLFTSGLIIDTFLHHRLQPYLDILQEMNL